MNVHWNLGFIDGDSSVQLLQITSRCTLKQGHFTVHKSHTNRSGFKKSKRKEVSYKIPRLTEAPWESWWAGGLGGWIVGTEMDVELRWDDTQYLACFLGQGGNSGRGHLDKNMRFQILQW